MAGERVKKNVGFEGGLGVMEKEGIGFGDVMEGFRGRIRERV
ncbi:hypothetical protein [Neisseria sicca]|nr:hypothetical protein [Neisseria sicca]